MSKYFRVSDCDLVSIYLIQAETIDDAIKLFEKHQSLENDKCVSAKIKFIDQNFFTVNVYYDGVHEDSDYYFFEETKMFTDGVLSC